MALLLIWSTLTLVIGVFAEDTPVPIAGDKLLGWWGGGDANDLNCILVFESGKAKILTFRGKQHLSTVETWYRVQSQEGRVTLGINGEAIALHDGSLQLKLTRQFDHIVVLREATLRRMAEPAQKDSPK